MCNSADENSRHLYFNCPFSKEVWSKVKHALGLPTSVEDSGREWNGILRLCKGKSDAKEIYKFILCATVYGIWRERNHRQFRRLSMNATNLARDIVRKVRKQLSLLLTQLKETTKSKILCDFLNISPAWTRKHIIRCQWEKPGSDEVLIKADGSVSDNSFGFGGLL